MTMISRYRKQSINHLTINRRQHDESWCIPSQMGY